MRAEYKNPNGHGHSPDNSPKKRRSKTCPTCGALLLFPLTEGLSLQDEFNRWVDYLRLQGKSTSYTRKLTQRGRDYLVPFFRSIEITTYQVQLFHQHLMAKGIASKTIKHILDTLRGFLNHMLVLEVIERVPVFPRATSTATAEKNWLGKELQGQVISMIHDRHKLLFEVLCETGIRPGEVCALRKRDIEGAGLWIVRAFDEQGFVKGTKTGKEIFRPITEELQARLIEHVRFAFPEAYVFQHAGKPYTRRYLHDLWERAAGVEGVRITLYQAGRHSKVSQLRQELERDMHNRLRDELGHTSAATTMKHYALPGTKEIKR